MPAVRFPAECYIAAMPISLLRPPEGDGDRPAREDLRADALAGSRHQRLGAELRPAQAVEPEAARGLCAAITRRALGDLAPALLLLGPADRERAQALGAYVLTLFDFARQRGVEGERLAQIQRWEATLEVALDGTPVERSEALKQPIFQRMAAAHARAPWDEAALARLASLARQRVLIAADEAWKLDRPLATAVAELLIPGRGEAGGELGAAWLALARAREAGQPGDSRTDDAQRESEELAELGRRLAGLPSAAAALPSRWRAAGRYLELAAAAVGRRMEKGARGGEAATPRLGLLLRLVLLVRARGW